MRNFICDVHLSSSTGTQAVVDVVVCDHSQAMCACFKFQNPVAVQTHAHTNPEFIGYSPTFPAQLEPKVFVYVAVHNQVYRCQSANPCGCTDMSIHKTRIHWMQPYLVGLLTCLALSSNKWLCCRLH